MSGQIIIFYVIKFCLHQEKRLQVLTIVALCTVIKHLHSSAQIHRQPVSSILLFVSSIGYHLGFCWSLANSNLACQV